MFTSNVINNPRRTLFSHGFFKSGILKILVWPLLCLLLAAGLWYWTISKIDAEKRAGEKKALEEVTALCKDYARYLSQAIEQANQITLQLQQYWGQSHGKLNLRKMSQGGIFRSPHIVNVIVVNREGRPVANIIGNPQDISYADRDYFVYHKNDDSKMLLIGKPLVARSTGKPVITFSRRLNTPQGTFDGVVLVAYAPHYLTAFYAGPFPGKTGLLMVAGLDGTLRSAIIGGAAQDSMSAVLHAVPLFNAPEGASYLGGEQWFGDKLSRYVAWKTLKEYPLVAMVGLSEQEFFAPYQKARATDRAVAVTASIILFLFALTAAGMSARIVRKKQQEEEVRKAYRIATEGGSEGYYMFEVLYGKSGAIADFVLVDCNERGAEFYGIPQMQILRMKLSDLYSGAHFDELMNTFCLAMASGFYEDEIKTSPASKLQIEWAKIRLVRSGNGLAVTLQDISEQKLAEVELRHLKNYLANIIDSMPSLLVGLDSEGRVTQWNRQAEASIGVASTEAVGRKFDELVPDFTPWIEQLRSETQQRRSASLEKLLIEKGGERRFYDLMLYPLIANGVDGAVVRIEDVTERARIQELMIQTEKMMSVGGLAAGMAHEINNPLGIITQAAQNIERRISPDLPANQQAAAESGINLDCLAAYFEQRQIYQFIASIREAAARASRIITNILSFSRRAEAALQPASLADIMEQAVELAANDYDLKKKFDFRSIEIIRDYQPDLALVPVVATEIEQVLLNLLKNAAQAMVANPPERKPRITLRIRQKERYAVIEVEDNGPGMTEEIRRRVFEPFFTTKEPGIGTGLGLSVSYMIITQNHKGMIEVASQPGNGACFTVRLPLNKEQSAGG